MRQTELLRQNHADLRKSLVVGLQSGGGTGLFDAIYFAAKEKMTLPPTEPYQPPKWQPPAPTVENRPAQTKTGWWSKRG